MAQPEGRPRPAQRVKERKRRGGLWLIPLFLLAFVAGAYLALCVWVDGQQIAFPNVTVAGRDISGMDETQVAVIAREALEAQAENAMVTIAYGDYWSRTISAADLVPFEDYAKQVAFKACLAFDGDSLLKKGALFLGYRFFGNTADFLPEPNYGAQEQPALDALLKQAQEQLGSDTVEASYRIEGDRLVMTKGITDVSIDSNATALAVFKAMEETVLPGLFRGEFPQVTVEMTTGLTPPVEPNYRAIHTEYYLDVVEPAYDKATGTVSDHVVGVNFDMAALQAAYEGAAEGETFSIPLILTYPKDTKAEYEAKLFCDTLGTATSKVTGTANRKTNVKLSAAACDGVVLLPGEIFAYNQTTGSRTADKGYLPAPTYSAGASVDDVGGGICQTSSTIYYAVLHTTLDIVERQNHSYATGYVPDGMDATVFFGSLDFRFQNNTNYPIKILTESYDKDGNRYLRVKLLGTNETGRYAKPTNEVYDVVQPTNSYVADSSVPRGTLVLDKQQNAYRGRKAQVFRTIYEADGTVVEKQDMGVSRYKMRPNLYHYNPLDGDPSTWPNGVPPQPAPPAVPETTVENPVGNIPVI